MSNAIKTKSKKTNPDELPRTAAPPDSGSHSMTYAVGNLQGIGKREQQEDSFGFGNALDPDAIDRHGLMLVMADGMGGIQNGKQASEAAVDAVLKAFSKFNVSDNIPGQLESAVLNAGKQVWEQLHGNGGTTIVAGLIYKEKAYCISVGDSYIGLLHDGELVRLNHSHNVLNRDCIEALQEGIMDYATALRNPERDAITHFLGMQNLCETEVFLRPLHLYAGDVLILCSDGISGVLTASQMKEALSEQTPEKMCQALEKRIQREDRRYQDNYTALIVQCRRV